MIDRFREMLSKFHFNFTLSQLLDDLIAIAQNPDLETLKLKITIDCVVDIIKR